MPINEREIVNELYISGGNEKCCSGDIPIIRRWRRILAQYLAAGAVTIVQGDHNAECKRRTAEKMVWTLRDAEKMVSRLGNASGGDGGG